MESLETQFAASINQRNERDRANKELDQPGVRNTRNRHSLQFNTGFNSKYVAEDAPEIIDAAKGILIFTEVAFELVSEPWKHISSNGQKSNKRLAQLIERAQEWVERNAADETLSVTKLANALNMSRTSLHRKLLRATDLAPGEFIREVRLQRAHHLLIFGDCSVSQAAYAVGFVSLSGFSRAYRARYGAPPSRTLQEICE